MTLEVLWLPCSWVYQHVLRLNVFYCWVTNYHIFQVLKHLCLLSNTCVVPKSITVWFSAQSLTRLKLKCRRSCIIGRLQERIWFQAYSAFPKIWFLQAVGLNSHFFCWPLTSGHSLLLETFRSFSHDPLSRFKLGMAWQICLVFCGVLVCLLAFFFPALFRYYWQMKDI